MLIYSQLFSSCSPLFQALSSLHRSCYDIYEFVSQELPSLSQGSWSYSQQHESTYLAYSPYSFSWPLTCATTWSKPLVLLSSFTSSPLHTLSTCSNSHSYSSTLLSTLCSPSEEMQELLPKNKFYIDLFWRWNEFFSSQCQRESSCLGRFLIQWWKRDGVSSLLFHRTIRFLTFFSLLYSWDYDEKRTLCSAQHKD